jgi:hypothetical protein
LRKFASAGISLLAVVVVLTMLEGPADARVHRHHRHHRHRGGGVGVTCGAGTVNVNGVCTPTGSPGPIGNGNVNFSPNSVTMNLDGSFSASVVVSGLPPNIGMTGTAAGTCGPNGTFNLAATGATDALGRLQVLVFKGAPGCVPGSYPVVFTETGSPFQSFTGFLNLHF